MFQLLHSSVGQQDILPKFSPKLHTTCFRNCSCRGFAVVDAVCIIIFVSGVCRPSIVNKVVFKLFFKYLSAVGVKVTML